MVCLWQVILKVMKRGSKCLHTTLLYKVLLALKGFSYPAFAPNPFCMAEETWIEGDEYHHYDEGK
jgi:hypothetical protein